ncbi:ABC transporter ATP-binding protein [Pseudoduganella rhizocola]|uniref:ABC transporter ATP-binding protein n=1 Tax=Pseudoduganella rhizocola TaxID=3382643 RepID=UPI0038B5588C
MTTMLETRELSKSFSAAPGLLARLRGRAPQTVYAVNRVSLSIAEGEVLGLVGESGCGKSTVGRMVAGLLPPTSGSMELAGRGVERPGVAQHRLVQMVFQNPYASLNPRLRIEQLVGEAALYHGIVAPEDGPDFVRSLLSQVGLDASYAARYPRQFSGGQRQRIAIARALALRPRLIVCDEAVSALDVSVQAQILNLFMDLREAQQLTYLFISHNLAVVEHIADRVAVMYLGQIVELADTAELFARPNHPYTQALTADAPRMDGPAIQHRPIQGELPSPLKRPGGCAFHPRCPHAMPRCAEQAPAFIEIAPRHWSACHLNEVRA